MQEKNRKLLARKKRIKAKLKKSDKPRLVVNRYNTHHYVQLIDDLKGVTLVGLSDIKNTKKATKTEKAKDLGTEIAKKALEMKIDECVFDRNGYKYTGRVKALADAAREAGLKF